MGFLFPDPPKQPVFPQQPLTSQTSPVPPEAAPWFKGDQIAHGMAEAGAEALRRRQMTGGDGPPPPPPGEYRPR